jgi:hypothetical protein
MFGESIHRLFTKKLTIAAGSNSWLGMSEPLRLTDLVEPQAAPLRLVHGYASAGNWPRYAKRVGRVAFEATTSLPRDAIHALSGRAALRIEPGAQGQATAISIALYVHFSVSGEISQMVLGQIGWLQRAGFAVVFISMSKVIPDDDWQAVQQLCALVVQRQNFGRDFGAWRDLIPEISHRWSTIQELMLVNDSNLGPFYSLEPVLAALRSGGNGLFGLTESRQGSVHLQSYLLLARGNAAANDLMEFIRRMYISHSKWLLIRMGELRLTPWMRRRGHRVAALFGYDRLIAAVQNDPAERAWIGRNDVQNWPLNPTHHLWHVLLTRFDFPFIKTELILHNPGRLPRVMDWPTVIPADAPCSLLDVQRHLIGLN